MDLREVIQKYKSLAGDFGQPVELSRFGLSHQETEKVFGVFDEDYHISRFFHFSELDGPRFTIDGVPATHVSLDPEIESIL